MYRFCCALVALVFAAGCSDIDDLSKKPTPIGEFALGHNVVVAPNLVKGPASREADKDVWIAAVQKAVGERFERFDGDQLYHLGISLEGYVLAQPGLPIVLSPKSVLILKVTLWDDASGTKLNAEPEQITVLEKLDGDTIVGSGLTKTAEEQMETLSVNAAKLIQRWMIRKRREEGWFERDPAKVRTDIDPARQAAAEAQKAEKAAKEAATEKASQAAAATKTAKNEAQSGAAKATSAQAVAATEAAKPTIAN